MTQTRAEIEALSTEEMPSRPTEMLAHAIRLRTALRQLLKQTAPPAVKEGELLPCPFCAGEGEFMQEEDDDGQVSIKCHTVACNGCGCRTKRFSEYMYRKDKAMELAIQTWNTRAVPQPTKGE